MRNVLLLEKQGFYDMKISVKSSDTLTTVSGYRQLSEQTDYPLHIGVTEAGGLISGTVKSSVGLGLLLYEGIGDTLRVSLTRPPLEEVRVAFELLRSLQIRSRGPELISCPTCGRTELGPLRIGGQGGEGVAVHESAVKGCRNGLCPSMGPGRGPKRPTSVLPEAKGPALFSRRASCLKR